MPAKSTAADPFALITRSLNRGNSSKTKARGKMAGRDPATDPELRSYLRARHADYDEYAESLQQSMDYKRLCSNDAQFASRFRMPPLVEPVRVFEGHSASVDAICWVPGTDNLVTASHDTTLRLWDASSGRCLRTLTGHESGIYDCAVSPDGRSLVSCSSGSQNNVFLWDIAGAKVVRKLDAHRSPVYCGRFSSDGQRVLTTDKNGCVAVHRVESGKCELNTCAHFGVAHGGNFFSKDSNLLSTCGRDGSICFQDLRTTSKTPFWHSPSTVANFVHVRPCFTIKCAHDGYAVHALDLLGSDCLLSVGADNKLKRWDVRIDEKAEVASEYLGHTAALRSLATSPDAEHIVTCCEDGSARVFRRDQIGKIKSKAEALTKRMASLYEVANSNAKPEDVRKQAQSEWKSCQEEKKGFQTEIARMSRESYGEAAWLLNYHRGVVSAATWRDGAPGTARIATASWDQCAALFEVALDS